MSRRYLVVGNWKMNGGHAANSTLLDGIRAGLQRCPDVEIAVCPPAPYLDAVGCAAKGSGIALGAQNLSEQEKPGAFTGEIFGGMLAELGCRYVLVGHSERRVLYGESDEMVARKFKAAQASGLTPILCVGETLQERDSRQTEQVLQRQLDAVLKLSGVQAFANSVVAYEPVWAIGTGRNASAEQAQQAHAFLRARIAGEDARIAAALRLLYGGSVKPDNAGALFKGADVDGGLIGGASLKADEFLAICAAAQSQNGNR